MEACTFKKDLTRGLLIVFTGNGKGKTTAALGCAVRALGHGYRVCMIQFIKGSLESGEQTTVEGFGDKMRIFPMGDGFIWGKKEIERNRETALRAWEFAEMKMRSSVCDLLILDELTYLVSFGFLKEPELVESLKARRENLHVIVTGRCAPESLIEAADMVTEMNEIKHPFGSGIRGVKGIDF